MNKVETHNLIRISKKEAKKLYESGQNVIIVACKMNPENHFLPSPIMNKILCHNESFEVWVNSFTYYNCNNETGRYPAFYKER